MASRDSFGKPIQPRGRARHSLNTVFFLNRLFESKPRFQAKTNRGSPLEVPHFCSSGFIGTTVSVDVSRRRSLQTYRLSLGEFRFLPPPPKIDFCIRRNSMGLRLMVPTDPNTRWSLKRESKLHWRQMKRTSEKTSPCSSK